MIDRTAPRCAWPPAGWPNLYQIDSPSGQAVTKNMTDGKLLGHAYSIVSVPLFRADQRLYRHDIAIEGWEYTIQEDSTEYPILSLSLYDRFDLREPREHFISDIKTPAGTLRKSPRSARHALNAALFLIRQISGGFICDYERVLKIYGLLPRPGNMMPETPGRQRVSRRPANRDAV